MDRAARLRDGARRPIGTPGRTSRSCGQGVPAQGGAVSRAPAARGADPVRSRPVAVPGVRAAPGDRPPRSCSMPPTRSCAATPGRHGLAASRHGTDRALVDDPWQLPGEFVDRDGRVIAVRPPLRLVRGLPRSAACTCAVIRGATGTLQRCLPRIAASLERLERYYDTVPRAGARTEEIGPFTLFVSTGTFPFYARPRLGLETMVAPEDVAAVVARQQALGVPVALEWVVETTPLLTAAARPQGSRSRSCRCSCSMVRSRCRCRRTSRSAASRPTSPTSSRSWRSRPWRSRTAGPRWASPARPSGTRSRPRAPPTGRDLRERIATGAVVMMVAEDMDGPVATGVHQPVGDTTEIVGVATLPSARRRGLGAAVTAALVAHATGSALDLVFLSRRATTSPGSTKRLVSAASPRRGRRRTGARPAGSTFPGPDPIDRLGGGRDQAGSRCSPPATRRCPPRRNPLCSAASAVEAPSGPRRAQARLAGRLALLEAVDEVRAVDDHRRGVGRVRRRIARQRRLGEEERAAGTKRRADAVEHRAGLGHVVERVEDAHEVEAAAGQRPPSTTSNRRFARPAVAVRAFASSTVAASMSKPVNREAGNARARIRSAESAARPDLGDVDAAPTAPTRARGGRRSTRSAAAARTSAR